MEDKIFIINHALEADKTPSRFSTTPLDELPLTMVYGPMQSLNKTYPSEDALCRGTLFPELDKPFKGRKAK